MRCLLLCLVALTSVASAESVEQMLSSCRWIETAKISAGENGQVNVNLPQDFESGRCWGAFGVVQDVINIVGPTGPILSVCAPAKTTRTQLITVFVDYAKRHPTTMSENFFPTVWPVLIEAFPCPKTQQH
jgi:hypothetical protein